MNPTPLLLGLTVFAAAAAFAGPTIVYVSESDEKRIAVYSVDESTGELTRQSALELSGAPGSLSINAAKTHLYASVRTEKAFASIPIDAATGALAAPVYAPSGANAAYVQVDASGQWLLGASYSEGVVTVSRIEKGIVAGPPIQTVETGKRAHCIRLDAANRFAFVPHVMDLNKVEQFRFDPATGQLSSNTPPHLSGGEGQGPRHMQFHPNGRWAYLVNEQGQSVSHCDYDAASGTLKLRETVTTTPPDWDKSKGSCADIHVSQDGKFVYASNRGHDSLAVFSVHPETGALTALGQTPT